MLSHVFIATASLLGLALLGLTCQLLVRYARFENLGMHNAIAQNLRHCPGSALGCTMKLWLAHRRSFQVWVTDLQPPISPIEGVKLR